MSQSSILLVINSFKISFLLLDIDLIATYLLLCRGIEVLYTGDGFGEKNSDDAYIWGKSKPKILRDRQSNHGLSYGRHT